jgi:hypothetical protein
VARGVCGADVTPSSFAVFVRDLRAPRVAGSGSSRCRVASIVDIVSAGGLRPADARTCMSDRCRSLFPAAPTGSTRVRSASALRRRPRDVRTPPAAHVN